MNELITISSPIIQQQAKISRIVFDALMNNTKYAYESNLKAIATWNRERELPIPHPPNICNTLSAR